MALDVELCCCAIDKSVSTPQQPTAGTDGSNGDTVSIEPGATVQTETETRILLRFTD